MRFRHFLIKNQIQEWKHYYINFEVLRGLLKVLRVFAGRLNFRDGDHNIHSFSEAELRFIEDLDRHFLRSLQDQLLKFHAFITYKQNFYLAPLLIKFVYNVRNFREHRQFGEDRELVGPTLRNELEKFYQELSMVRQFMGLNFLIYERLCRHYRTEFERISLFRPGPMEALHHSFLEIRADSVYRKLDSYMKVVATIHEENFFDSKHYREAHRRLELVTAKSHLSSKESFYFGFYIGAFAICILLITTLLTETKLFDEAGSDFVTFMFPIFRGALMLYLYWFLMGVDIYVWDRYNINFRRVFDVQHKLTSSAYQVMRRAFGFLMLWILVFSYCALSNTQLFDNAAIFNKVTSMYIAPGVWLVFFLYLLFPSTQVFNYEGRLMFFQAGWEVLRGPFGRISTRQSWCMTQMLSFLIVLKDLLYSVCYAHNVYDVGTIKNDCQNPDFKFMEFMIIFIICFWKNVFGINKFVFLHRDRHLMTDAEFKTKRFAGIRGLTKGAFMTVVAIVAYNMKKLEPYGWWFWFVATCILTVWSSRDDLVDDWGFLQTRDLLRAKLAYPKKRFYYFAMCFNVLLRLAWVVNLSPAVLTTTLSKNVVGLALTILEAFRVCVWNFFKIENDHLKFQGNFNFINSYSFPYDFELDMNNLEVRASVAAQTRALLKNAFVKHDIFGASWDPNVNLAAIDPAGPEKETARASRLSELGLNTFKSEKEHKADLERFDESLTECQLFRAKASQLKVGAGKAKLTPEQLARFSGNVTLHALAHNDPHPPSAHHARPNDPPEATLHAAHDLEKGLVDGPGGAT